MRLTIQRRDDPLNPILALAAMQRIYSDGMHVVCVYRQRRAGGIRVPSTLRLPLTAVAEMHLTEDEGEPSDW